MLFAWTDALRDTVARVRALKKGRALRSQYLFTTRNGDGYYNAERRLADGFDAIWKRYMAKAKLRARELGKELEHFTEHDIRAKNASDEIDSAVAQERLGHATVRATKIYRRKTQTVQPLRKGQ